MVTSMKYPVCCHSDDGTSFSITVPDVPGCFGAGDTVDDALADVESAIHAHFELLAEDQQPIPQAGHIFDHKNNPDYADGVWALVEIDPTPYMGKAQKINVTLPGFLIHQIERKLQESNDYKNRSQFLAIAAERLLHSR